MSSLTFPALIHLGPIKMVDDLEALCHQARQSFHLLWQMEYVLYQQLTVNKGCLPLSATISPFFCQQHVNNANSKQANMHFALAVWDYDEVSDLGLHRDPISKSFFFICAPLLQLITIKYGNQFYQIKWHCFYAFLPHFIKKTLSVPMYLV